VLQSDVVTERAREQKPAVSGVSTYTATRLAWSLAGLSVAISVARIALYVIAGSPPSPHLTMWRVVGPTIAEKRTVATVSTD
jgi:hypothetical protein